MAVKTEKILRVKMPVSERAKQFMPFSALKGLDEALSEQEIIAEERTVIQTERGEDLPPDEDN